ncbi:adenosylcobyric acid synthase (glutamine-hydrolysing) [Devosia lucknowensis]|uniref:Cobyric acid synthase n=1 Tax=Devosia lucknowensis TaxID=1096929 RepID=A0A1Y6EFP1_9HYPH|nr:cobyric acid synthase [Devosia lucknowensis]SMQ59412.1 adenosylcobyric acid synthase (glutamine-hydrolysing) [Devosia lucknowensis]
MTKALMFMGTGSDVGKSLIVAGLCRALSNRGMSVAPFKPQNMSNNAAVTADGGEIGRAQALQARAARRDPVTAMNPVLLKPEGETGSQVVVRGQRRASLSARQYWADRAQLLPEVLTAFCELASDVDIVLVEGAGSASEVNLRRGDIANFGFAQAAKVPVVLIGDIHRGGVIASIVGTLDVIDPQDAALVRASLINKFFGDPALFESGKAFLETRTGLPCLGPVPHFADAARLPAEDALALDDFAAGQGAFHIAVPRLPRIANFDDLDPLRAEPGIRLTLVQPGEVMPRDADLVLLPGSKATRSDLAALRANGWDIDIVAHHRAGRRILGICGGYQMLGRTIADPDGIEGPPGTSEGLGLLDVDTVLAPTKQLRLEAATHLATGEALEGYHMHMGVTSGPDAVRPFASVGDKPEGAISANGRVAGTYLHGLFSADGFRRAFLGNAASPDLAFEAGIERVLDTLANHLETHIDIDRLLGLAAPLET